MSTKPENLDTSAERVHGIDAGVGGEPTAVMDAIDADNGFRRYPWTYTNQPGNVGASALGAAALNARPGGDSIDHGLSLLRELGLRGLGIVRVPRLMPSGIDAAVNGTIPPVAAAPDGFVMVPREPTDEMQALALSHLYGSPFWRSDARPIGAFYSGHTADESEKANIAECGPDRVKAAYAAMLAAAPTPPVATDGWLPIDSAPRDVSEVTRCGEVVLLGGDGWVSQGFYHDGSKCYGHRGEAGFFDSEDWGEDRLLIASNLHPTHWMPLPAAPANGGG